MAKKKAEKKETPTLRWEYLMTLLARIVKGLPTYSRETEEARKEFLDLVERHCK